MPLAPPKTNFEMTRSTKFQQMPRGRTEGLSVKSALGQNRNLVNASTARELLKDFGVKESKDQTAILEAVVDKGTEGNQKLYDRGQVVTSARAWQAGMERKSSAAAEGEGDDES